MHPLKSFKQVVSLTVEYTTPSGQRKSKAFNDAYAARRFYASKFKAGCNPKLLRS